MIKLLSRDENGYRLCLMSIAEIYKYIYKHDKIKKNLTYADIQSEFIEKGMVADGIDEKGLAYYYVGERNGRYFLV